MPLDFGTILRRAWQITWQNKILWLFGILAALAGGSPAPRFQWNFGSPRVPDMPDRGPNLPPGWGRDLQRLFEGLDRPTIIAIGVALACVALLVALAFMVLGAIGRGGLVGGTRRAAGNGRVTFAEAWADGTRYWLPVLLIALVVGVAGFVVGIISVAAIAAICLIPLGIVGFLAVAALGVYGTLAQVAAVTDNLGVVEAFRRAWELIRTNLGNILLLVLILVVVNWVAALLIGVPLALLVFPILLAAAGAAMGSQTALTAGGLAVLACFVAYLPVALLAGGILQSWYTAAWTLAYEQLTGRSPALNAPGGVAPA